MFDLLTVTERYALRHKLYDWARQFADIGHTLSWVALADGGPADPTIWDRRDRYYDAMTELHELRDELAVA